MGKLEELGITIERSTKLTDFVQDEQGVKATLNGSGGQFDLYARFVVGCDGARSRVREVLNLGFGGGTYEQLFYVADVKIDQGFDKDIHINLGEHSLVLMMPVRATGMQRILGLVPDELSHRKDVSFDDFRGEVEPLLGVSVTEVNWFSTYRVHHRVVDHFRVGNVFVAGDAGHLHSPAGGQGMNTGIGDAINLGWKLAEVMSGRANMSILDSYEAERLPFAKRLVASTDRAFEAMIAEGWKGNIIRNWLAPAAISTVSEFAATRHAAFRTLSQIGIEYRDSPLSEGSAGVHAGDRLPWVKFEKHDNFAPLQELNWQIHVYGEAGPDTLKACHEVALPVHHYPFNDQVEAAGIAENAVLLIRPDGYVALAANTDFGPKLIDFQQRFMLTFDQLAATQNGRQG